MTLRLALASTASLTGAKHCVVCWQLREALFADARAEAIILAGANSQNRTSLVPEGAVLRVEELGVG